LNDLFEPAVLRRIVLALGGAETLFWLGSIVASAIVRSSDPSGGLVAAIAIFATLVFFVLTLPALALAWYWRYLPAATILVFIAGLLNTVMILILAI